MNPTLLEILENPALTDSEMVNRVNQFLARPNAILALGVLPLSEIPPSATAWVAHQASFASSLGQKNIFEIIRAASSKKKQSSILIREAIKRAYNDYWARVMSTEWGDNPVTPLHLMQHLESIFPGTLEKLLVKRAENDASLYTIISSADSDELRDHLLDLWEVSITREIKADTHSAAAMASYIHLNASIMLDMIRRSPTFMDLCDDRHQETKQLLLAMQLGREPMPVQVKAILGQLRASPKNLSAAFLLYLEKLVDPTILTSKMRAPALSSSGSDAGVVDGAPYRAIFEAYQERKIDAAALDIAYQAITSKRFEQAEPFIPPLHPEFFRLINRTDFTNPQIISETPLRASAREELISGHRKKLLIQFGSTKPIPPVIIVAEEALLLGADQAITAMKKRLLAHEIGQLRLVGKFKESSDGKKSIIQLSCFIKSNGLGLDFSLEKIELTDEAPSRRVSLYEMLLELGHVDAALKIVLPAAEKEFIALLGNKDVADAFIVDLINEHALMFKKLLLNSLENNANRTPSVIEYVYLFKRGALIFNKLLELVSDNERTALLNGFVKRGGLASFLLEIKDKEPAKIKDQFDAYGISPSLSKNAFGALVDSISVREDYLLENCSIPPCKEKPMSVDDECLFYEEIRGLIENRSSISDKTLKKIKNISSVQGADGRTLLHVAIENNCTAVIKVLMADYKAARLIIESGKALPHDLVLKIKEMSSVQGEDGKTLFNVANVTGNAAAQKQLADHGDDFSLKINQPFSWRELSGKYDYQELRAIIEDGDEFPPQWFSVMQILSLERGDDGKTLLHVAIEQSHAQAIQMLINEGANEMFRAQDSRGRVPSDIYVNDRELRKQSGYAVFISKLRERESRGGYGANIGIRGVSYFSTLNDLMQKYLSEIDSKAPISDEAVKTLTPRSDPKASEGQYPELLAMQNNGRTLLLAALGNAAKSPNLEARFYWMTPKLIALIEEQQAMLAARPEKVKHEELGPPNETWLNFINKVCGNTPQPGSRPGSAGSVVSGGTGHTTGTLGSVGRTESSKTFLSRRLSGERSAAPASLLANPNPTLSLRLPKLLEGIRPRK